MTSRNVSGVLTATSVALAIATVFLAATAAWATRGAPAAADEGTKAKVVKELSLDECIDMAMANNHRRPASSFAVAMAEAHKEDTVRALAELHVEPAGRQILTLFKVAKLVPFQEQHMDTVRKLRGSYDQLRDGGKP